MNHFRFRASPGWVAPELATFSRYRGRGLGWRLGPGLDPVSLPVCLNFTKVTTIFFTGFEVINKVIELQNADNRDAEMLLYFLDGRKLAGSAFLAIERNQNAGRLAARALNDIDGIPDRSSGRNDVIQDQYPAVYRCPDPSTALVTGFGTIPYVINWGNSAVLILERG